MFSCTDFNLFKPANFGDLVSDLPADQQIAIANDAIAEAMANDDDEQLKEIANTLIENVLTTTDEEGNDVVYTDIDDVPEDQQEVVAEAAETAATAIIQSSPVGDIIESINTFMSEDDDSTDTADEEDPVETIISDLIFTENPETGEQELNTEAIEEIMVTFVQSATLTNLAAEYDQQDGEIDVDLQFTNAIMNLGAAIFYETAGNAMLDDNGDGFVDEVNNVNIYEEDLTNLFTDDGINISDDNTEAQECLHAATASLEAIVTSIENDPEIENPEDNIVYDIAKSLLEIINPTTTTDETE
jgi:hypothetical protein